MPDMIMGNRNIATFTNLMKDGAEITDDRQSNTKTKVIEKKGSRKIIVHPITEKWYKIL